MTHTQAQINLIVPIVYGTHITNDRALLSEDDSLIDKVLGASSPILDD